MLIVRGINVFPSQVEHALMSIPGAGNHFQVIVERTGALGSMTVRIEVSESAFSDKIDDLMALKEKIAHTLRNTINIKVNVELVEPGSLPRSKGKADRVIDKRWTE